MARVIFLDIDGVLNVMSPSYNTLKIRKGMENIYIERMLVERLLWLIEKTDAVVVISSSWRHDMDELQIQMSRAGMDSETWEKRVVGKTPTIRWRGDEITAWMANHTDITSYVVLEDEPEDVCGDYCDAIPAQNVVHVDMKNGLTHQDIEKAKKILEEDEKWNAKNS